MAVQIENLSKRHGSLRVIQDFSLSIQSGEFLSLVGPSGCGKTTLLHLIAGLESCSSGKILYGKENPRIGMVFQTPRLLPWRNVAENLMLAMGSDADLERLETLMNRVGLPDAMSLYPERLSIGMLRRVSLVRAFAIRPDLLLMDEPMVSLDAPTARKARELLVELWKSERQTILFVTHDLREAIELSDRIAFVSSSPMKVISEVFVDLPREDRTQENIESLFMEIGEAAQKCL